MSESESEGFLSRIAQGAYRKANERGLFGPRPPRRGGSALGRPEGQQARRIDEEEITSVDLPKGEEKER